ncbi:MAG: GtrA family protein [Myxococcales bacterium]|nr:GtrA family protein [Myxococcales bacterium]
MRERLRLLGRHQLASLSATAADFCAMIALVELAELSPVLGAALGAALGAVVNFLLNRRWVFHAERAPVAGQALRYALVSLASAVWNALGEHLLFKVLGLHYVVARVFVSVAVSLGWNFPLQRGWVFRTPEETS